MYKRLLLIIALGGVFKNFTMKIDNHDYLILTNVAQKIFPLYEGAQNGNKAKMYVYQDFLNVCMNKDHQLNPESKKTLKSLELLDEKTQTLININILSKEQNINEFLRILELIKGGFIKKNNSLIECFLQ